MQNASFQITQSERDFAVSHLQKTRDALINAIENLTEEQWYYRPEPGQWTPAQCASHLLETELYFFMPTLEKMLAEPANPERMKDAQGKDQICYMSMEDRSFKIKGQPRTDDEVNAVDKEALIAAFLQKRNENIEWLKSTTEELRAHFTIMPFLETLDAYQFILFVSGHTTRHTLQILETLNSVPAFSEASEKQAVKNSVLSQL